MMTSLQMQLVPHFLSPVNGDPMELTSDLDQRVGGNDDIDIDLDLTGDSWQDGEDEYMGEEDMNAVADSTSADEQEIFAANDAEMADDSYTQGLADAGSPVRDEEIEDAEYNGLEMDEGTLIEPDTERPDEHSEELLANYEEAGKDQSHAHEYEEQAHDQHQHHGHLTMPETESGFHKGALLDGKTELVNPNHDVAKAATDESTEGYNLEIGVGANMNHGVADQVSGHSDVGESSQSEAEQEKEQISSVSLDQEVASRSHIEGSHIEEEDHSTCPIYLHPIVLNYQGDEMYLFPPVDENGEHATTFLLADEQLAYSTIGTLLEACRCVLKESLNEQDELMINIDDLDLRVSESMIECASTRFAEVVDLYLRLQQNDGLENPPPLYMDLTIKSRFSHRLNVLRSALTEGTGLSQLKLSYETDTDHQHRTEEEGDISNHTAEQPSNRADVSVQQPAEKAEGSVNEHNLHGYLLPTENLVLETGSTAQAAQSYPIKDVTYEKTDPLAPLPGSDSSARETGVRSDVPSEVADILLNTQTLAHDSELQTEESIVDDGDFIDYEDVEELNRGTSSASSTLQGDTINVQAAQDRTAPNEPRVAQNEEQQSPSDLQGNAVMEGKTLHEEDSSFAIVSAEDEQHDDAQIPSEDSDEKDRSVFAQFNEEEDAAKNGQDTRVSPGTESQLKVNAEHQHEASTLDENDAGSKWQGASYDHADQPGGGAYPLAGTHFDGEVEDYSLKRPLDSESSGSRQIVRDDRRDRVVDLEVENGPEEAGTLLINDNTNDTPQPQKEVNRRPSLSVDESAQMHEDDDEITYEDEEYTIKPPHGPVEAEYNAARGSGLLKHARSLHEGDNATEEDLQGAKRIRSG